MPGAQIVPLDRESSPLEEGTTGLPEWYQTAVLEVIWTWRAPSPYQLAIVAIVQRVIELVKIFSSVGSLMPFLRGRPFCLRLRGGAGS